MRAPSIALILMLAACGEETTPPDCVFDDPDCDPPADDAQLVSDQELVYGALDAATYSGVYEETDEFGLFLDEIAVELESIPVGSCAATEPIARPETFDDDDLGAITLVQQGAPLAEVTPEDNFYQQSLSGLTDDPIDIEIEGAGPIAPVTFTEVFSRPIRKPVVTGPLDGTTLQLGTTVELEPRDVDHLIVKFNSFDGAALITVTCAADPATGTLTLDAANLAKLAASGTYNVTAFDRQVRPLATTDGVPRAAVFTTRASGGGDFSKSE